MIGNGKSSETVENAQALSNKGIPQDLHQLLYARCKLVDATNPGPAQSGFTRRPSTRLAGQYSRSSQLHPHTLSSPSSSEISMRRSVLQACTNRLFTHPPWAICGYSRRTPSLFPRNHLNPVLGKANEFRTSFMPPASYSAFAHFQ